MPAFLAVLGEASPLCVFRAYKAPEAGSMLEAARLDGGESIQHHGKSLCVVVTVSETAGHRATVSSAYEKPGAYGVPLEEPLAGSATRPGKMEATANPSYVFDKVDFINVLSNSGARSRARGGAIRIS